MKLYIRNKFISLGGSSKVVNEKEELVYSVKGRVFSPTRVKKIYDTNENFLYKVRNKFFNFFNTSAYIYNNQNEKIAKLTKKFFAVGSKFFVEGYKDEIKVEGDWMSLTLRIIVNGVVVGSIRKEFFALNDCYELDSEEQDMSFLTALVIAIDNIIDNKRNNR